MYSYAALKKMVKEYHKFDKSPEEYFKTYEYDYKGKKVTLDIGYEQFLGPEALFHPEIVNPKISPKGLPELVDEAVLACPIDVRRSMYKVLCGLFCCDCMAASLVVELTHASDCGALACCTHRTWCYLVATHCSGNWPVGWSVTLRGASTSGCEPTQSALPSPWAARYARVALCGVCALAMWRALTT